MNCDCGDYPPEVERDCCCVGGTECKDGTRRPAAEWDPPGPVEED